MNIEGLDYNTQRKKLILPEYGREIQSMVDYAVSLPDKNERQYCAETIISIMDSMYPQNRDNADHLQKLWDHLALMSNFKLDIDWPFDVHYGNMVFELFEKLKTMSPGEERDELLRITARQMKSNLMQWGHGSTDNEKVISDLARFTDGAIQLDPETFKFDKYPSRETDRKRKKK